MREADDLGREPSCFAAVEAVTRAGEDDEPGLRHKLGGAAAGQLEWVVLVGVAVDDEGGDVDAGQVGVEVINLSETSVTLGQIRPVLPRGGLRLVSQQWAPCGALAPSWQAADGGMIVYVKSSTGEVIEGSSIPTGAAVLPPNGTAWLSATFQVLVACPRSLSVQFSVGYRENGRKGTAQLAGFLDLGQVTYTGCNGLTGG